MLEAGLIASRFLHYVAVLTLFGASLFPLYTFRDRLGAIANTEAELVSWLRKLLWRCAGLGLLSALGWFVFATASMAGDLSLVFSRAILVAVMTATDFGPIWAGRLAVMAVVVALLLGWPSRWCNWLVPIAAALLLGSLAAVGHTRTSEGISSAVHVTSDAMHLLATGLWLGGLLPLGFVLAASSGFGTDQQLAVADFLKRFSGIATRTVAVLVVSGVVNGWFLVGSVSELMNSNYGRILTAKVLLFLLMLALASLNRFWITPRLGPSSEAAGRFWIARVRQHVLLEQLIGLSVLGLVSVLGTIQPAISS